MIFGIKTLFITSASRFPGIAFIICSSCKIVAFKSFKSDSIISSTLLLEAGLNPLIFSSPFCGGVSSPSNRGLNLKFGAKTCSINSDAVIAFSILFTDSFTSTS